MVSENSEKRQTYGCLCCVLILVLMEYDLGEAAEQALGATLEES